MAVYLKTALATDVAAMISGDIATADLLTVSNRGVREVLAEIDLRSTKRKSALSPNMFDEIFEYTCPTDLKDIAIIDVMPQVKRGRFDYWKLTTQEEFDRYKKEYRTGYFDDPVNVYRTESWIGDNLLAFSENSMVRKLLISRPIDDSSVTISELDSLTSGGGTWSEFGDGDNVTQDSDNFVKGSGSLNWDIDDAGGTTAGIVNSTLTTYDITDYLSTGSIFCWAYITSATNLTNYIIRVGSSSSNYYTITITTDSGGNAFAAGWNLLRFDFINKAETGTVDPDACDYLALYMTKATAKVSETDYRFDWIVMKKGDHYNVLYYSKYGWQNTGGTWIENATADTDYLNVDTTEYDLITEKVAELAEMKLRNSKEADRHRAAYEQKKLNYIFKYPSEAMIMENCYYDL